MNRMNGCEKYADWMMDAALGALPPEREGELRVHMARCEACHRAYEQARQFAAALGRGLESLVTGEPSPQFAAHLRARIADERPTPRFAWLIWKPLVAALALASILAVAGIAWMARHRNSVPNGLPSARDVASIRTPGNTGNSAKNVPTGTQPTKRADHSPSDLLKGNGRVAEHRRGASSRVTVARLVPRRHAVGQANSPAEPEVIVPPGQLEAVMQFAAAIRSGRIDGKQLLAARQDVDKPIEIQPLEIKAIETPTPKSDTPGTQYLPADSSHR